MSFENILPIICFLAPIILGILLWYEWFQRQKIKENIQRRDREERWIQEEQRKCKYEEASQTYKELKAVMGEEIDKTLEGQDSDSIVEILNYIGRVMNLAGCSISEMADAFNALETPSAETTETQEQKEPQVIFEPKVMIIEPKDQKPVMIAYNNIISVKQDDKEVNPLDDWYNNFMKEIGQ